MSKVQLPARERARRRVQKESRQPWKQDPGYDGADLPDDDFDYDDFVAKEFGAAPDRRVPIKWYWWLTAVVLLALMMLGAGALL